MIDSYLAKNYFVHQNLTSVEVEKKYGKDFNFLLANLLFARGIKNKKEVEEFLNPDWEKNHNPFLFSQMKKAVQRIKTAIAKEEKILIFSDYDTDGIPGGAILYNFFKKIEYKNFQNFIPNRNKDGYGLTAEMAKKISKGEIFENSNFGESLADQKFKPDLVITIDCGISDLESAQILKKAKIDLIITDHHLPKEKLPAATAILNPKLKDEKYPEKNLCGAGVVFKLVQALVQEDDFKIKKGWEKWLLDLTAIATVCDMVPLLGENRLLVKYGQIVFKNTHRPGLNKIIEKSRLHKKNISEGDLGFMIGPRINAAARLEEPSIAFKALAENNEEAIFFAEELEKINNRRKYLTAKIMREVYKKLAERKLKEVIVIGNKDWPLGILGLVAGKIADKYQKPTFVWSVGQKDGKDIIKGSCRSGGKYSVHSLMSLNAEKFIAFGGHQVSGGFALAEEEIHFLEEELAKSIDKADLVEVPPVILDAEISLDEVSLENYYQIEKLAPYGIGNQKPHFFFREIEIFNIRKFGKDKNHLELIFKNSRNFSVSAIAFNFVDLLGEFNFKVGDKINLVASFELNRWNGNEFLRLKIEDIF